MSRKLLEVGVALKEEVSRTQIKAKWRRMILGWAIG